MNGSHALTALILIALDANEGRWCALPWLAERVLAPLDVVLNHCDELVAHDQVETMTRDGIRYFGFRIVVDQAELVQ